MTVENELIDEKFRSRDVLTAEKFRSRDLAVTIALQTLERRLDGMNEFRAALQDQTAQYLTRAEYNVAHEVLAKTIDQLRVEVVANATWTGRLWALGTVFLMKNVFISWYLSGVHLAARHP